MTGETISIDGPDGAFSAYLATPDSGAGGPGVVVIQEIFGINDFVRATCDRLAREGYSALAPDLFWRIEPGIELTDQSEEHWARAFELFGQFDVAKGVGDIQAAITHLRERAGPGARVGAVGYCLGGQLAYLTACRTDADCAVGYYGVRIDAHLDEAASIAKPLMLHIAGKDEYVPPEAQRRVMEGLAESGAVTIHFYPEMDHAFAREGGAHYNEAQARTANHRTGEFFKAHLD